MRNNNPGNLVHGVLWKGLSAEQTDSRFAQFSTPEMGIRAMVRNLVTYNQRYHLTTVEALIGRWSGDPLYIEESYIDAVKYRMGIDVAEITIGNNEATYRLVEAMIIHENGYNPYTVKTIRDGIAKAFL